MCGATLPLSLFPARALSVSLSLSVSTHGCVVQYVYNMYVRTVRYVRSASTYCEYVRTANTRTAGTASTASTFVRTASIASTYVRCGTYVIRVYVVRAVRARCCEYCGYGTVRYVRSANSGGRASTVLRVGTASTYCEGTVRSAL